MAANAPSHSMKKLINNVDDLVSESLAGLGAAHADLVRIDAANNVVIRKDAPRQGIDGSGVRPARQRANHRACPADSGRSARFARLRLR